MGVDANEKLVKELKDDNTEDRQDSNVTVIQNKSLNERFLEYNVTRTLPFTIRVT